MVRVAPGTRELDFDDGFADSGQVTAERGEVDALRGLLYPRTLGMSKRSSEITRAPSFKELSEFVQREDKPAASTGDLGEMK